MSPRVLPVSAVLPAAVLVSSCSTKRIGISRMADAVSSTASAYARDDDPEFVRLAAPSTLKVGEMLVDGQPRARGLLIAAGGPVDAEEGEVAARRPAAAPGPAHDGVQRLRAVRVRVPASRVREARA